MPNSLNLNWRNLIPALLILSYPVTSHIAVIKQSPWLIIPALLSLSTGILFSALINRRPFAWQLLFGVTCLLLTAYHFKLIGLLNKIPPLLILLLIGSVFWASLRSGRIPLITEIGESARGPLTPQLKHYTLRLTQAWALILLVQWLFTLYLSVFGPDWLWALTTHYLNYAIVLGLFVGEFYFRKLLFPDHNHPGLFDYIKIVVNANIRKHRKHD